MAKDEKKLPEEQLKNLEIGLDEVAQITGGQGPVIHDTGDIGDGSKKKS